MKEKITKAKHFVIKHRAIIAAVVVGAATGYLGYRVGLKIGTNTSWELFEKDLIDFAKEAQKDDAVISKLIDGGKVMMKFVPSE